MLENSLFFIFGLAALTLGAELMVRGAARLALTFGISPLVVGLTIVAFGTSAPEMAVSVGAALNGTGDLAIGNIVGSNIANILLILGLCALIVPAGGQRADHPSGSSNHDRRQPAVSWCWRWTAASVVWKVGCCSSW